MRHIGLYLVFLVLLAGCAARPGQRPAAAAVTTVYIVRHAEKELAPGLNDPPLTPEGQQRAQDLRDTLQRRSVVAIFTTATARTRATATPLAQALNLPLLDYDARQLPALAARIRREFAGRAVLVVGHSNTILETAEALGAERPVPAIGDKQYDYLLEVKIPARAAERPTATARRYGATH